MFHSTEFIDFTEDTATNGLTFKSVVTTKAAAVCAAGGGSSDKYAAHLLSVLSTHLGNEEWHLIQKY